VSVRGGRPLRRQIEAALSGEADPLGEDGLGFRPSATGRRGGGRVPRRRGAGRADPARQARPGAPRRRGDPRRVPGRPGRQGTGESRSRRGGSGSGAARTPAAAGPARPAATPARERAFAALRQRLGTESAPLPEAGATRRSRRCRTAPRHSWPRRSLSMAAPVAPASGSAGSPATPRSAIGWPRSCSRGRRSRRGRSSGAALVPRLRAQRAGPRRDRGSRAALAQWRSGRARVLVASVQALLQHTLDPAEVPAEPGRLRVGARLHQDQLLRELLALATIRCSRSPARRVRPPRRPRGRLPVGGPLPIRIEMFGDEIDSMRSFDRPTSAASARRGGGAAPRQ